MPACLLGQPGDLIRTAITIDGGQIGDGPNALAVDMGGAMVLPAFVDMHTHLDKGHIWPRSPNPDGTFMGALTTVGADRAARWTAEDVRRADGFLAALRPMPTAPARSARIWTASRRRTRSAFRVFARCAPNGQGRIDLQAACLIGGEAISRPTAPSAQTADIVADAWRRPGHGHLSPARRAGPHPRLLPHGRRARACRPISMWTRRCDPASNTLRLIAEAVLETGFRRAGRRRPLLFRLGDGRGRGAGDARPRGEGGAACGQPADVQPLPAGPPRRTAPRAGAASRWCTR